MRVFSALFPPREISEFLASLGDFFPAEPPIGWQSEDKIHLTLNFLPNVAEEKLDLLQKTIEQGLVGGSGFTFQLGLLGAFPSFAKPRVIWISLKGDLSQLTSLQKKLETALLTTGFSPRVNYAFKPHLTLARPKKQLAADFSPKLTQTIRKIDPLVKEKNFLVDKVHLMRSVLRPTGSDYQVIRTYLL